MSAEQTNQTQSSFEYTNQPNFTATAQHTNKLDNNKMDNNNFVYQSMFDFRTIILGWSFCWYGGKKHNWPIKLFNWIKTVT